MKNGKLLTTAFYLLFSISMGVIFSSLTSCSKEKNNDPNPTPPRPEAKAGFSFKNMIVDMSEYDLDDLCPATDEVRFKIWDAYGNEEDVTIAETEDLWQLKEEGLLQITLQTKIMITKEKPVYFIGYPKSEVDKMIVPKQVKREMRIPEELHGEIPTDKIVETDFNLYIHDFKRNKK
ncbi:hypothetical protein [Flammeovirga sp. SubArs3]|uniref:hypothetical protein n=1 Tax=Flammeovirga sp. SubArs3 TaxID=2995316 RepID=UPI00248BE5AE|nr:hypothetical protein [Flammeovirga sp. SubArs3]